MRKKLFYWAAGLLFLLDRLTKLVWAESSFTLLPHVLAVHGTRNTGMAFGWFAGGALPLAVISVLLLAGVFWYMKTHALGALESLGLGLLAGGALGNLFDRLAYGYVIDMFEPLFVNFFIFNMADAGITVGAVLLGIHLLFGKDDTKDGAA